MRRGLAGHGALTGQRIEVRRRGAFVAVGADMVRAQRVDRDDDQVLGVRRLRRLRRTAGGERQRAANARRSELHLPAALEPFGGRHLALRLGRAPLAVEDVRQDEMAERRDLRVRLRGESLACPLLGAREVARIQQRLREVELARAEVGLQLDRLAEASDGFRKPALLLEQLRDVEGGSMRLGVRGKLGLVGRDRLVDVAAFLVDEPEVEVRGVEPGLLLERQAQRFLGLAKLLRLDLALAQLQQEAMLVDLARERVLDHGLGLVRMPLPHEEIGELPEHLAVARVELLRALEADARFFQTAEVLVGDRQAEQRALVLGVQLQGLLVGSDGRRRAASPSSRSCRAACRPRRSPGPPRSLPGPSRSPRRSGLRPRHCPPA